MIRAVVRKGIFHYHDEFVGFLEGWRGLIENQSMPLDLDAVSGILPRGGTVSLRKRCERILPSVRTDLIVASAPSKLTDRCLVAIGGDDTLVGRPETA